MRLKDEKFYKTVRDFLDIYLIKHRGYSLNTQKSYREAINLLLLYFKTELGLEYASIGFEDITYSNITGFLEWLSKSRGCSPATVNLRLMAIRSFTKYRTLDSAKSICRSKSAIFLFGKLREKSWRSWRLLHWKLEQPQPLQDEWIPWLLLYAVDVRHRSTLPGTGGCKNSWFERSKDSCNNLPYWKGNNLANSSNLPSVVELLKTYLDKAHPTEQRQSDDYLFFTTHHGRKSRMSTDAVNLFMKKYGEMARWACPEVPERVHPHQLRRTVYCAPSNSGLVVWPGR